jgi:hypothetical protein
MVNPEEAVIVNALMRQALVSAQKDLGENGLNAVLRSVGLEGFIGNFPPNDFSPVIKTTEYAKFNKAIEAFYGRAGKGMLRRFGKATFQFVLREQVALMGVAGEGLKLMPQKERIKVVLGAMVNILKNTNPQVDAWLEDEGDKIAYCESTCAVCLGRHSDQPVCHLNLGSIAEAVFWATEQEFEIIETHCIAKGDKYCRFEVGEIKE